MVNTENMQMIDGVWFDPETGRTYIPREDGGDPKYTGFTFEAAAWSGPRWATPLIGVFNFFGNTVSGRLNPLNFATAETAQRMLNLCKSWAPELTVVLDDEDHIVGPFTRTIERSIVARLSGERHEFNAGRLASSVMRHGSHAAALYWRAELRQAGFQIELIPSI